MAPRHRRVCAIFLPQCKTKLGAVQTWFAALHLQTGLSCPGRAAACNAAAQSRDLDSSSAPMGPGSAAHHAAKTRRAALRPGHETEAIRYAYLRDLAACLARVMLSVSPLSEARGAGKAGRRLAPAIRTRQDARGGDLRCCRPPGLPCAMVLRLMARSPRGAMHCCPRRPAAERCGRRLAAASPQALTPAFRASGPHALAVRGRPAPDSGSSRVPAPDAEPKRCDHAGRPADRKGLTGVSRPALASRAGAAASIASRPAVRDDRETPLQPAGMRCGLAEI
jgi:hypothetical protein